MIDTKLFVYNIDFLYDHIEYHLDNPTIKKKFFFFFEIKKFFLLVNQSMYMDNNEQNNKYHYHLEIYMSK